MLQLNKISKQYRTGDLVQQALDQVSLSLRDNEFVSILGPSGSGKTTLLNVIGGLDRYDSGDLVINGVSTKQYRDRDWDSYRNHTIGFVFQSYNLIPHQSVLANVELALTISGVSRGERRQRAKQALEEVGLGNQLHKRPSQMSGGQMQRVAIARALVNDPDILLADEPTGALDSETSIQIMELLKRVAKDRLVVMVTHNPELAQRYSTRIVKLRDGKIIDDSDPYTPAPAEKPLEHRNLGKAKMSFGTSLALSFNNLRTKKGRTVLTAFAGSIGIIGIALILAFSHGVNGYITDIQRETMTSYPVTITAEAVDMSSIMGTMGSLQAGEAEGSAEERDGVWADHSLLESSEALNASIKENNLTSFKEYLDDPNSEIQQYLGENGVVYTYDVRFSVYSRDEDGALVPSDADPEEAGSALSSGSSQESGAAANMERMRSAMGVSQSAAAENFSQLLPAADGGAVSPILTDSYQVLYGSWPQEAGEVVLVLDEHNSIPTDSLYQLGLITGEEYQEIVRQIEEGEEAPALSWDYEQVCGHTFTALPACSQYVENENGTFTYVGDDLAQVEPLLEEGIQLTITGVVRPLEDAANATISTPVAYTYKLTDEIIQRTDESAVVQAQEADPQVNVLNGLEFEAADDAAKVEEAKEYLSQLSVSEKASFYSLILYSQQQNAAQEGASQDSAAAQQAMAGQMGSAPTDEASMAAALDAWLQQSPDEELLLAVYDEYIGGASYEDNLTSFGKVSYGAPSSISIYTDSFEDKEAVSDCIAAYNAGRDEEDQITYTDYVALLTGSITSIVDMISYVLIAFVGVSLIVSSIMIGIITHISVLERTKEIGILRAIGASKGNIAQVFNAETLIIGLLAGAIGVGASALLTLPINSLMRQLLGAETLTTSLPLGAALILVALSMAITLIAGLVPARSAAKKDPVAALRSE